MRQTYTDDSKHYVSKKKVYKNYIKNKNETAMQNEIHRNTVPQGDWGKVETDPTQGYGTRLNNDMRYHLNNRYNYTEPVVKTKKYAKAYSKAMKKK